jgi:hypothetical protein
VLKICTSSHVKESEDVLTDYQQVQSEMLFFAQSKKVFKNLERKFIQQSLLDKEELGEDLTEPLFTSKIMQESSLITKDKPKVVLLLVQ